MKHLLLAFLVGLIGANSVYAQDLIVTTSGDSIPCKITRERGDYVYFTYNKQGVPTKTLLAASSIAAKRTDFYDVPVVAVSKPTFSRWQYRFHGGYSRRIARISDQVSPTAKAYLNKMKSGYTLGGDIHYFISEPFGLGAKYGYGHYQYKTLSFEDKVKLNYFAISGLNRFILKTGGEIYMGGNLGYQSYKDQVKSIGAPTTITGGTMGVGLEIGYGMKMNNASKLYLNLSLLSGTITKVNVENNGRKETVKLEKDEYESLSRLEVTLGLVFGH